MFAEKPTVSTADKSTVSAAEIFTTVTRSFWPVVKIKLADALQQEDVPVGDTMYKLRVTEIDLQHAKLELLDFVSTGTRSQNDVMISKQVLTAKNPFLNWTSQDVGRWVSTMGPTKPWDSYETLIQRHNVTGLNLTTMTLQDFESVGIPENHVRIIIHARDKILGFNQNFSLPNTEKKVDRSNIDSDLTSMLKSVSVVANEEHFQRPMESWSVATVHNWITKITHFHLQENPHWKKCIDIIYEHMIDGKTFEAVNANVLIQYGMDESCAIALIQTRDEFLNRSKMDHNRELPKHTMDGQHIEKTVDNSHEQRLEYETGIFEFSLRLHGPLQLRLQMLSNEGFVPDCSIHVRDVDFAAKVQIEFDIVRNIIQISFLEKPKIKTDIDVKVKLGFNIPLFGEDLWLPTLAETILEKRNKKNPIIIRIDNKK